MPMPVSTQTNKKLCKQIQMRMISNTRISRHTDPHLNAKYSCEQIQMHCVIDLLVDIKSDSDYQSEKEMTVYLNVRV